MRLKKLCLIEQAFDLPDEVNGLLRLAYAGMFVQHLRCLVRLRMLMVSYSLLARVLRSRLTADRTTRDRQSPCQTSANAPCRAPRNACVAVRIPRGADQRSAGHHRATSRVTPHPPISELRIGAPFEQHDGRKLMRRRTLCNLSAAFSSSSRWAAAISLFRLTGDRHWCAGRARCRSCLPSSGAYFGRSGGDWSWRIVTTPRTDPRC